MLNHLLGWLPSCLRTCTQQLLQQQRRQEQQMGCRLLLLLHTQALSAKQLTPLLGPLSCGSALPATAALLVAAVCLQPQSLTAAAPLLHTTTSVRS